ncbi:MAG: rane protein [Devosia sp.]|uniref:DMT family protein n=1 Tax=Devosia sp. TaxID=1871048 RepID=UPI00261C810D|nr:DMT family protein [Devosia sp.]MDB5542619.1 rane protein [Devosia sp.]
MPFTFQTLMPILLLIGSNVFMTIAWYGHLKFPSAVMWVAVMGSWGIALVEYWLAVPANRIGYGAYTAAELKTIQEVISLAVFAGFAVFVLGEKLTWNHAVGFTLILAGAFFIFRGQLR